jgi:DNA-binding CsgD family transcriptional regulator
MAKQADHLKKGFAPMKDKTLQNVLSHRIGTEFPRIGGPRIRQLCAQMILEVIDTHVRSREKITHGQALWMAVSVDDPPCRHKRISETNLVPVVLDLSTADDIERVLSRVNWFERLTQKAIRLCRQAYAQGGLLSNVDLSELLRYNPGDIGRALADYERRTNTVVPRRATVHDVGAGLTHKRIICLKRYAEGKSPQEIARQTYHSLEAVDRYLGQYDRVRHCRQQGMIDKEIAYTLSCSISLVRQYLAIDDELQKTNA